MAIGCLGGNCCDNAGWFVWKKRMLRGNGSMKERGAMAVFFFFLLFSVFVHLLLFWVLGIWFMIPSWFLFRLGLVVWTIIWLELFCFMDFGLIWLALDDDFFFPDYSTCVLLLGYGSTG